MYVITAIKPFQTSMIITANAVITAIMASTAIMANTANLIKTATIAITTNIHNAVKFNFPQGHLSSQSLKPTDLMSLSSL